MILAGGVDDILHMHNNLSPMHDRGEFFGAIRNGLDLEQMTPYGDVFDTPPAWTRVLLGVACLVGGILTIVYLVHAALVVPLIITAAALILTIYLMTSVTTAAQLALVTIGFWAYLGILVLMLP
jgi:hypothetical protein